MDRKNVRSNGQKVRRFYYTTDINDAMTAIRERQQAMITDLDIPKFSVHKSYGQRPEEITGVYIDAGNNIPTIVLRPVPEDYEVHYATSECAFNRFGKAAKHLRYRGEVASVVGERLRLYVQKVKRSRFDATNILRKQHGKCKTCGIDLDEDWDLDHVQRLADGGQDTEENIVALCLTCHQEKTTIENGSRLYHKSLYSTWNVDAQEGFVAAAKPQQLFFGDGKKADLEIDCIRSRPNALLENTAPLPVFTLVDTIQSGHRNDADFYYIDAGDPVDEIREGAFYMGPHWYWKVNASAIMQFGRSKRGGITTSDVLCTLTASQHEPANTLVAPYKEIESIVTEALAGCDKDTIKKAY